MKIKNPILFWLVFVFTALNIIDVITTLFILPGESNILYLMTGHLWPVLLIKLLFNIGIIYLYKKNIYPSEMTYYLLVTALVIGVVLFALAQYSNISAIFQPKLLEEASNATVQEKAASYITIILIIYIIPLFFCVTSFIAYNKSKKRVIISKEYYKKRKWWQF